MRCNLLSAYAIKFHEWTTLEISSLDQAFVLFEISQSVAGFVDNKAALKSIIILKCDS